MKKTILLLGMLSVGYAHAQEEYRGRVGINTEIPKATLDIKERIDKGTNKPVSEYLQGLSLPNFTTAQREEFGKTQTTSMKVGTIIYNTSIPCIEMYKGWNGSSHVWECINTNTSTPGSHTQTAAVTAEGWRGTYIAGVSLNSSNTVKFKIKNNSIYGITGIDLSNAVKITNGGSTATINPGQYTNFSLGGGKEQVLTYTLKGIPKQGAIIANFDYLGLTASQETTVAGGTANINQQIREIRSFDTTQGKINNTDNKIIFYISYTGGKGAYEAVNMTLPTIEGENGDQNNITLSIPAGTFSSSGTITATVTVDGDGEYLVKKLVGGIKQDIVTFPVKLGDSMFNVIIRSTSGYTSTKTETATRAYTKNDCMPGYRGSNVDYTRAATVTQTSWTSQSDADTKATNEAKKQAKALVDNVTDGQAYANINGTCTPTGVATFSDKTEYILSFDTTQGKINNTNKLTIQIPYSRRSSGAYTAVQVANVRTAPGENGDENDLTLDIPDGLYNSSSGYITATITVSGDQEYLVRKTEGTPNGYEIARFPITMSGGEQFAVILQAKGGWRASVTETHTRSFTKNNCASGFRGTSVTYTSQPHTAEATSVISQSDAESKARNAAKQAAIAEVNANGQAHANTNGTCTRISTGGGSGGGYGSGGGGGPSYTYHCLYEAYPRYGAGGAVGVTYRGTSPVSFYSKPDHASVCYQYQEPYWYASSNNPNGSNTSAQELTGVRFLGVIRCSSICFDSKLWTSPIVLYP